MSRIDIAKVLADNVNTLLDSHNEVKTQTKLAARSGVGQSTISRVSRKDSKATIETVDAIAAVYKLSAAQLLTPKLKSEKEKEHLPHKNEDIQAIVAQMELLDDKSKILIRGVVEGWIVEHKKKDVPQKVGGRTGTHS